MKKQIVQCLIASAVFASATPVFAGEAEEFFYQRGYNNGYNSGYDEGVKRGVEIAKETLKRYKANIEAYEVGKYLIESKRLTYPQVWQELNDNGVKLVVTPSKIEKELNIDALFDEFGRNIPIKASAETTAKIDASEESDKGDAANSVYLSDRDSNANALPDHANRSMITLAVAKNYKSREVLDKANIVYADRGNDYEAVFFTQEEKNEFCKQNTSLCRK